MSKVDAQRAMKVARNARSAAEVTTAPRPASAAATRAPAAASPAPTSSAPSPDGADLPTATAGPGLCGHRNMAGKECRRPAGHAEKSHRYS